MCVTREYLVVRERQLLAQEREAIDVAAEGCLYQRRALERERLYRERLFLAEMRVQLDHEWDLLHGERARLAAV